MANKKTNDKFKVIKARVASLALTAVVLASPLLTHAAHGENLNSNDVTSINPGISYEQMVEESLILPFEEIYLNYEDIPNTHIEEDFIIVEKNALYKYDGPIMIELNNLNVYENDYSYFSCLKNASDVMVNYSIRDYESIKNIDALEYLDRIDKINLTIDIDNSLSIEETFAVIEKLSEKYPVDVYANINASSAEDINIYKEHFPKNVNSFVSMSVCFTKNFDFNQIEIDPNIKNLDLYFGANETFMLPENSFDFLNTIPNTYVYLEYDLNHVLYDANNIERYDNIYVQTYGVYCPTTLKEDEVAIEEGLINLDWEQFPSCHEEYGVYCIDKKELNDYTGTIVIDKYRLDDILEAGYLDYFPNATIGLELYYEDEFLTPELPAIDKLTKIDRLYINMPGYDVDTTGLLEYINTCKNTCQITVIDYLQIFDNILMSDKKDFIESILTEDNVDIEYIITISDGIDFASLELPEKVKDVRFNFALNYTDSTFPPNYFDFVENYPNINFVIDITDFHSEINISKLRTLDNISLCIEDQEIDLSKYDDIIISFNISDTNLEVDKLTHGEHINYSIVTDISSLLSYKGDLTLRIGSRMPNIKNYEHLTYIQHANKVDIEYEFLDEDSFGQIDILNNLKQVDSITLQLPYYNDLEPEKIASTIKEAVKRYPGKVSLFGEALSLEGLKDIKSITDLLDNTQLNEFQIIINTSEDIVLSDLQLPEKISHVTVLLENGYHILDSNSFEFLKGLSDVTLDLAINNYYHDYDILELNKYNNLKEINLKFYMDGSFDFDFKQLTKLNHLNSIDIECDGVTDVSIYFDNELLDYLTKKGIKLSYNGNDDLTRVHETNEKLEDIIEDLGISSHTSEIQKYNLILAHILENYKYDPIIENVSESAPFFSNLVSEKYTDGALGPVFDDPEGEIICGNYSALFEALANRVGIDSMIISANNHSWNIVKLGNEYYHTDACWLDGFNDLYTIKILRENNQEELKKETWYGYKIDEEVNLNIDYTHYLDEMPIELDIDFEYLENREYEAESDYPLLYQEASAFDITNQTFEVEINQEKYIVPAAVMMGIIVGMGQARNITKYVREINTNVRKH